MPGGYSCGRSIFRNEAGRAQAQGPAATRIQPEGSDRNNGARVGLGSPCRAMAPRPQEQERREADHDGSSGDRRRVTCFKNDGYAGEREQEHDADHRRHEAREFRGFVRGQIRLDGSVAVHAWIVRGPRS